MDQVRPIAIVGRVLASLGTIALVSTVVTYALTHEIGWMIWGKLIFGTVALLFYFTTNKNELSRFFASRSTVYSTASLVTVAGFLIAIAAANFVGITYTREFDVTKDQIYSLSEQTEGVLDRLDKDIEILAFYRPEEGDRASLQELLSRYAKRSKHVTVTFVNPEKDPEAVREHQITQAGPRIVLKQGELELKLKDGTEEELTNAIVRAGEKSAKKIYLLTGHGEADMYSAEAEGFRDVVQAMKDEGYDVASTSLFDKTSVPAEVTAMVIAAPRRPLLQSEIDVLHGWLLRGGHMLVMLEPGEDAGLTPLLKEFGLELGDNMVIDPNPVSKGFGFGPEMPIVQTYEPHPITKGMKASATFPTVRSVKPLEGAKAIVKTSAESWAETQYRTRETTSKDADDIVGPVPIMSVSTRSAKRALEPVSDESRLLAVGDHEFASNRFLPILGNRDLFLNAVNWLVEEEERISIRPKARGASRLFISEAEANFVKFFSIDIIPMALLAMGVAVWQVRRRK